MRPIDGDEAIRLMPTWERFGVDERGRLEPWHSGAAYVKLEDVLVAIANLPTVTVEDVKNGVG